MSTRVPFTPGDLVDHQWGTDDILTSDLATAILIGDAGGSMFDFSKGGNDTFTALPISTTTTAYGDAGDDMSDHSKGGNDPN
ncbi:hypothetical protein NKI48_10645 [Mesorhizobium sp. M0644]|uniref:hypothetical protein n=1 Tax=unclassified Mesorhizobium TaxID=325217 RepID=UPI003338C704